MTSTSILLILVGIFVLLNASNFVKVFKGEAKLSFLGGGNTASGQGAGSTASTNGTSGNVEVQGGIPATGNFTSGNK